MSNAWNPWILAGTSPVSRPGNASMYPGRVLGSCGDGWVCGSLTSGTPMSGNATNDELPKLEDDEGGESTVAMDAPAIPNGAPLPVSQPPPAGRDRGESVNASGAPKNEAPPSAAARAQIPLPSKSAGTARMPGPRPPPARATPGLPTRGPLLPAPSARLGVV